MTTTTTRTTRRRLAAVGVAVTALFGLGLGACSDGADSGTGALDAATTLDVTDTTDTTSRTGAALSAVPTGELDTTEVASLLSMVQEEKLAHDVYTTLGELWGTPTFTNIAAAETTHTDAVRALLDRYGIADPTVDLAPGEFVDPAFTALYDDLVAQGRTSLTEALRVGALIEETDIADLARWTTQIDEPAVLTVYASLNAGSENHLRAFDRALTARGETYTPQVITTTEYEAITASAPGRTGVAA